ncbi:MAG: metallophosphoesterase [Verrucomicrobiota bacterium]|nr:metallophosphoesterase [Verrucomicrobiota bacterium]
MTDLNASRTLVAADVLLDGRLALYHQQQRWLAVADLHFGYELSQRAAGRLMPLWGMDNIERQLFALISDYAPRRVLILGDLVHDGAARGQARSLVERLSERCEVIVLAGNHDRQLAGAVQMADSWQSGGFLFHHGHCAAEPTDAVQVIGHHHPAGSVTDGAGLRLKFPAFVQQGGCWIMPAFSPWAASTVWKPTAESRVWLCTPKRVLCLPIPEPAVA